MQFSEDDLRGALRRKDPGESFTERVMAHVGQPHARVTGSPGAESRLSALWHRLWLRPVLTCTVAAVLIVGSLGLVHYRDVQERRAGEAAKQQALLALRITNAKLNHVIKRVRTPQKP